jgi:hypothetical protein
MHMYCAAVVFATLLSSHASLGGNATAPRQACATPPANALFSSNATRMFFIGAHHTGTFTYASIAERYVGFQRSVHDCAWAHIAQLWFMADAFSDTPFHYTPPGKAGGFEFVNAKHPDVRRLHRCFPSSLFVLNTRSMSSWLLSKFSWHRVNNNGATTCAGATKLLRENRGFLCQMISARETFHAAVVDFVIGLPAFERRRFRITDLPAEGSGTVAARLCVFRSFFRANHVSCRHIASACTAQSSFCGHISMYRVA